MFDQIKTLLQQKRRFGAEFRCEMREMGKVRARIQRPAGQPCAAAGSIR
jgi:hypothetical protein